MPGMHLSVFKWRKHIIHKLKFEVHDRDDCNREEVETLADDKDVELSEVSLANAVVDPGAVMVVSVHTALAKCAMAASGRPDHLAVGTETARLEHVQELDKVEFRVFLDGAGVREPYHDAKECSGTE